jgi:hypothetical protein
VEPLQASKLLPPVLGLVAVGLTYGLVRALHPWAGCAFLASVLLGWHVWQLDDVVSGTPRAFLLPLLAGLGWALVRGREVLAGLLVGAAALLYPPGSVVGLALLGLRLLRWTGWRVGLRMERRRWLGMALALGLVAAAVFPVQAASSRFGPVVTASQARQMPEFGPGGRNEFFLDDPVQFWLASDRSGLDLRVTDPLLGRVPVLLELAAAAATLPLLLLTRRRWATEAAVRPQSVVLVELLVASLAAFFLAHLLLFRLHLPNRYLKSGLLLVLACSAGLGLGILVALFAARLRKLPQGLVANGMVLAIGAWLAFYPAAYATHYVLDEHPTVSAYLRTLPKSTLVAGVSSETDSLASFAGRPVLFSYEHALAYHLGYYREISSRIDAELEAYYSPTYAEAVALADRYGIDIFLVNRRAYGRDGAEEVWTSSRGQWEPFLPRIREKFGQRRSEHALYLASYRCPALVDESVVVVRTRCLSRP